MFQKLQINTTPKSADRRMSSEKTVNILCSRVLSSWIFMSFDAHLLRSYEQSFDLCYNWIRMEVILQQHWNRVQNILFWMVYNHLLLKCLLGRHFVPNSTVQVQQQLWTPVETHHPVQFVHFYSQTVKANVINTDCWCHFIGFES